MTFAKNGGLIILELPLTEEIGNAIIDYLKYGRPKQDTSEYVFVRHSAPYPDTKFTVVLAYDTDVFEFADKPHVDWKEVDKALTKAGATQVIHLPAKRSIEDWFLLDEEGVKRYLHLQNNTQLKGGTGLKKLEAAFKKSNKVYVKGTKVKGFVDALNVGLIASKLCRNLQPLCGVLSIDCHRDGCCINDHADK